MGKYIKSNSVFTLRKKIQNLEDGSTILERDWTTLGEKRRFGKGKIPIYNDGNFIFTRNNIKLPSRRSKNSSESVELRYNDVKDAKSNVNNVEINNETNDIRSFVYYGSCVDLVDKSISNIILNFPACIGISDKTLKFPVYSNEGIIQKYESFIDDDGSILYVVENPFNIDILSSEVNLGKYDNAYRYMCETYDEYEITKYETSGKANTEKIKGFTVDYVFDAAGCRDRDQWYNYGKSIGIIKGYKELHETNKYCWNVKTKTIELCSIHTEDDFKYQKCIKFDDRDNNEGKYKLKAPIIVTFITDNSNIVFYGFRNGDDFIFLCSEKGLIIKPNDEVIDKYFDNLKGFEKQLLTRKSNPIYQNTFITPIQTEESYVYVNRNYTWPSFYGYCINIDSSNFETFYNNLINMASIYDEIWTNNLYGRMTHEAIKNFDWTYTKDYVDGEEEENIEGGEQMQKVIHFIGRLFDEGKQYIDGIKNTNKITNDTYCNIPDALLSDTLELHGWDVTSVVPVLENNTLNKGLVQLDNDFIEDNELKWFNAANVEVSNSSNFDIKFMRRLLLSSKRIFQSKGTQESIDMIMGIFGFGRKFNEGHNDNDKGDYSITEEWYEFKPIKYYQDDNNDDCDKELSENAQNIKDKINELGLNSENGDLFPYLPLNLYNYKGTEIIIPFYDKSKEYKDINSEFYFQSKGGWGYKTNEEEYSETVSYLKVLSTVNDLLNLKSIGTKSGDIYYVIDLTDAPKIFGTEISSNNYNCEDLKDGYEGYSHFFYLKEGGLTTEPSDWTNIKIKEDDNGEIIKNEDQDMIKKALYLDNIINTSFGNNPHVGFGNYDNGETFYEWLKTPFKKEFDEIDEDILEFETNIEVETYSYQETEKDKNDDDKIFYRRNKCNRKIFNEINSDEKVEKINENDNEYRVRINSKVVRLTNNIGKDSELFKQYFRKAILPYIMQVIPSTTILILEDF